MGRHSMDLSRQFKNSNHRRLKNQNGFVAVLALSFLPLLISGGLALLISFFLTQNWMQSLHICRTELLKTQASVGLDIEKLKSLNLRARTLRALLTTTKVSLAAAVAAVNPPLIAELTAQIRQIRLQQKTLDLEQKLIINIAQKRMEEGILTVQKKLTEQGRIAEKRSPVFFRFSISHIQLAAANLAVRPDSPTWAPVYELLEPFSLQQTLHVSWRSSFEMKGKLKQWLKNYHIKKDSCAATLQQDQGRLRSKLTEVKSLWKL
jgi:hypothetical protein